MYQNNDLNQQFSRGSKTLDRLGGCFAWLEYRHAILYDVIALPPSFSKQDISFNWRNICLGLDLRLNQLDRVPVETLASLEHSLESLHLEGI